MIIQGAPDILYGPQGLGAVPTGMNADEYYGKINAYVQALAVSGLSPDAAKARLLQDMAATGVTVEDLHYATSMAPSEVKTLMAADPALVLSTAQATAVQKEIPTPVFTPPVSNPECPPGYAWDGETCRPTGLGPTRSDDGGGFIPQPPTPAASGGINPALILAAAAAYFFAG
jgi:hypothetical protein